MQRNSERITSWRTANTQCRRDIGTKRPDRYTPSLDSRFYADYRKIIGLASVGGPGLAGPGVTPPKGVAENLLRAVQCWTGRTPAFKLRIRFREPIIINYSWCDANVYLRNEIAARCP